MKKLLLPMLIGIMLVPLGAYAQEDDQTGAYLEARIQPSQKELRKRKKQLMTEHEIDSLIVSRDFRFEPEAAYTVKPEIYEYIYIAEKRKGKQDLIPEHARKMSVAEAKKSPVIAAMLEDNPMEKQLLKGMPDNKMELTKANRRIVVGAEDYIRIIGGWLESKLYHEWMPLGQAGPPSVDALDTKPTHLYTDVFKFTESTKEEDKIWFMTVEVDRMNERLKYEFVVQPTGWTALRCTSNRWGGNIIYTGWLIRN